MKKNGAVKHNYKYQGTLKHFQYIVMVFMLIPIIIFNGLMTLNYSDELKDEQKQKQEIAYLKIEEVVNWFEGIVDVKLSLEDHLTVTRFLVSEDFDYGMLDGTGEGAQVFQEIKKAYTYSDYYHSVSVYSMANGCTIAMPRGRYMAKLAQPEWFQKLQSR